MAGFGSGSGTWRGASGIPHGRQLFTLNQNVHIPPHLQPKMMAIDALGQQVQSEWRAEKQARAAEKASAELYAQTPAGAQYLRQVKQAAGSLRDVVNNLLTLPGFPLQGPEEMSRDQWLWDTAFTFYNLLKIMNRLTYITDACTETNCTEWYKYINDLLIVVEDILQIHDDASNKMRHKQFGTLQDMIKKLFEAFAHQYSFHRETFVDARVLHYMVKVFTLFFPFAMKFGLLDEGALTYLEQFIGNMQEEAYLPITGEVTRSRAFPRMTLNQ